ncbi:MAG: hypothetical protein ACTHNG_03370 [Ginsengibacter sp.]
MNKITIFEGSQNTGKTTRAMQIAREKTSAWMVRTYQLNYNLSDIEEYTQLLIFDEVKAEDVPHVIDIANKDFITFRQPYHSQETTIKRPEMLICTQLPPEVLLKDLCKMVPFEIVKFSKEKLSKNIHSL